MTKKILIAEDLEDNRFYLQKLLEEKGNQIVAAENGRIALQMFQETVFDMVMTDLRMPEMNGLTLLRNIKKIKPEVPVIIISAYREIENIIEALRFGACDYITKPYEEQDIINSIDRASRLAGNATIDQICAGFLKQESRTFLFDNEPDLINSMAFYLCKDLASQGKYAEMQSLQVALIEALNNAVFHGNLEVSSKLKTGNNIEGFEQFNTLVGQRKNKEPFRSRKTEIRYTLDEEEIRYTIRDEGNGFDTEKLPDPLDPASFIKPSGRGLLMIRTFCDHVEWNALGNEITLVKFLQPPP